MLRLSEIALLLMPFAVFAAWRVLGRGRDVPGHALTAAGFALAVCASALIWFGLSRALPPNTPYVPAQLGHGGRIIGPK